MGGRLILTVSVFILLFADAEFAAPRADIYDDCEKNENPEQGEGPCTSIINGGEQETMGDRALAYFFRGGTYYDWGFFKEAISDFNEANALDPNLAKAYDLRGSAVLKSLGSSQIEWAVKNFSRAIELGLKTANVYSSRAWAYQMLKEREQQSGKGTGEEVEHFRKKAIADYRKALEIDPSGTAAERNLKELM